MSIEVLLQAPAIGVATQGQPGNDGTNGEDGRNGTDGKDGVNGKDGRNGFGATYRPGDAPDAFTGDLVGPAAAATPLAAAGVVADPVEGNVYDFAGIGYVALREPIWLEPQAFYAVRIVFERTRDPILYESTALVVGVQWLDATLKALGQGIAQVFPSFLVANGRQIFTARIPPVAGDGVPLDPPAGAVFWRPFLQDASENGVLRVLGMTISDVTNAGVYAPDVVRLNQRVTSLEAIIGHKAVQA